MLPYDNRPWARTLAKFIVGISTCGLVALGLFLHHIGQLRISGYVALLILFLTIVPPNLAIVYRKRSHANPPAGRAILH